jgi:cobalt-zinc-cadmium efflux system membrane fusion protein
MSEPTPDLGTPPAPGTNGQTAVPSHAPPPEDGIWIGKALRMLALLLMLGGVLTVFAVFALGVRLPGLSAAATEKTVTQPPGLGVKLIRDKDAPPHTLEVPDDVRANLGILVGTKENVVTANPPKEGRPLELPGTTSFDPTLIKRIRARFAPAEVVSIGETSDPDAKKGSSDQRELRSGDWVKKGTELGVFFSVDVGNKKNDLFDALLQLDLDKTILQRTEEHREAVPEVFLLNARRNVLGDRNAIRRAENTLRAWGVPEEDITAVRRQAQAAIDARGKASLTSDKGEDKAKVTLEQLERWARVTLKAPEDGFIIERNVTKNEMVVDNTVNLFQITKVDRMMVVAYPPEDQLPELLKLQADYAKRAERLPWVVRTLGAAENDGIRGWVNDISYLIDVNQHSAVVKGYIDNPKDQPGEHRRLRAGQFVTVTIDLPPPDDVVEVPVNAVVDDGRACFVFVETDAKRHHYTLRRVEVTHRYEDVLFVRSSRGDVPDFNKRGSTDNEKAALAADVARTVVRAARPSARKITLQSYAFKEGEKGRTDLVLSAGYEGRAPGVGRTADITVHLDTRTADKWEVLKIDYRDDDKGPLKFDRKRVAALVDRFNRVCEPLLPGERVLTSGALELKKELEDRESNGEK